MFRQGTFRCSSPTKTKLNPEKGHIVKSFSTKMIDPNQKQNVRLAQHVMDTMNMQMIEMQYFMKDILKYSTDNQDEESNDGKIEAADKIAVKLLFNEDITDFFEAQEIMQKGYVNLVKQFTEADSDTPNKNSQKIMQMIKTFKEFCNKCIFCKKQIKKKRTGKELWEIARQRYKIVYQKKVFDDNSQLTKFIQKVKKQQKELKKQIKLQQRKLQSKKPDKTNEENHNEEFQEEVVKLDWHQVWF